MRKILVLRGGALGDFIVTLPALALLRDRWPDAHLALAGNAPAAALALDSRLLDRAYSQHDARWSALYSSAPLPPAFAAELATFDLVLNFWPDPDGDLARRFPLHADQIFLTASALPTLVPAAAHYCEPLRALGLTTNSVHHVLARPARDAHLIAVHPGSGSRQKNWPVSRWIELCTWLTTEHRAELLIITGEADAPAASALARFGASAHQLPLHALLARLQSCRFFLGHDSGISHLAAACSVPSLLLFGPTAPGIWAPPAPHVQVIRRGPTLDAISPSDVQAALHSLLAPPA